MKNLQAIRRVPYITLALNLTAMAAKLVQIDWQGLRDTIPRLERVIVHTEPAL